jgi:nucleoside-diphosphate-sugar epimerase
VAAQSIEGADAVVHAAGLTKARTLPEYLAANARGTEALARSSWEAAPGATFVLVSSQSAAGPSRGGSAVTEFDPPHPVSWYGISKLEGEHALLRHWKGAWSIVRPSVVYGAGDSSLLQLFATVARGWAPVLAGGRRRIQLIWAHDLARVLFAAATRPALAGRRGFAAGPPVTMRELVAFVASLRRPPARLFPVPAFAIRAAGRIETLREMVTRRARPFNRDKAREILQPDWICDPEPYLRDAGVDELRPWREGLVETLGWYQREGWLASSFGEL